MLEIYNDVYPIREDSFITRWIQLPFKEQIDYFRRKIPLPTKRWEKLTAEQHDWAFTVSGLTRADLLEDIKWLVGKAIADGEDTKTFTQQFKRLIGRKGWKVGEQRIYTILDTNSRRSYAAGRYEQATKPSMIQARPWWIWRHRDSVIPRPNHLALHNKAIKATDPFWKVATPSCAWGCRCTFTTADENLLNRLGAQILTNPPDPRTIADPGFQRAPGSIPEKEREELVKSAMPRYSPEIQAELQKYLAREK